MRQGQPEYAEQSKILNFLYLNKWGKFVIKIFINPIVSKIVGIFMNTPFSKPYIKKFISKNNIRLEDYEEIKYISFNDFFTRKIKAEKRPINMNPSVFISPCDARVTAYTINESSKFRIKNSTYTVLDLLNGDDIAKKYVGGHCLIFRLCVDDYHRYCYIDSGSKGYNFHIKGELHTVRPISSYFYDVYTKNSREYTQLNTDNFGTVIQIEVGAILIGRITNHHASGEFIKGSEKGMFEFGGSTIVLLVEQGKIGIDSDILTNSANGLETIVKMGEQIGYKI